MLKYSYEDFICLWQNIDPKESNNNKSTGIVLLLEPTPDFYKTHNDDKKWDFGVVFKYLIQYKRYIWQLLLSLMVATAISLVLPFLTQSIVDIGIGHSNISFVIMILVAELALVFGQLANDLIRNWLMLHMTTRIGISLISDFLAKLMRLPISFFDSRMLGDILQRIGDYERIRSFLTGSLLSIIMAVISFVVYGVIMGGYDLIIMGIFMGCSILYVIWVLIFLKSRKKLDYMRFQEAASNQSTLVQLINGMQEIKLNNCENSKRWEWERIQTKLFHISVKTLTLNQTQEIGATFIDQTKNIVISFLAAKAVIDGNMTLGMMMALQYIIGQLNAPISQFISFVQECQDAKISMERLSEIHNKDEEEPSDKSFISEIPLNEKIEFKNVYFRYGNEYSPFVLSNISFEIPPKKITAIVGPSGSGKTTLLKLLLGFYKPTSGSLVIGGINITDLSPRKWRSVCGTVMQDGYIFSDSVENNITIGNDYKDKGKLEESARLANIDSFITQLPLGYKTKIGSDGQGLSNGQRQRLLIARAAYKDAEYLIFDEATNSLDANNEKEIMQHLQLLFSDKTVVVVAHRLSTVKDADNIIVLNDGRIVESGNHSSLIEKKGFYYQLVHNQLDLGD